MEFEYKSTYLIGSWIY